MTGLNFDDLRWLHLLWAVVAVGLLGAFGIWRRRRALDRFAGSRLLPRLTTPGCVARPIVRLALIVCGLVALVAALVGPRWGEQTQQLLRRNIDVVVLLDVSRSMLAQDIAPNRLDRAKLAIRDDLLPALGGDRIGLIAFAGAPAVACPLTSDYGFYRLAVDDITIDSAPRGGTAIGDAIRKAGALFDKELETHNVIVLITDGEDQDSYPVEAASGLAKDFGARIITVALGDPERGERIPVARRGRDKYLRYQGDFVYSKADFETLDRIASASEYGLFLDVGTRNFDLGKIYSKVASAIRFAEDTEEQRVRQPSRYHPFALVALVLVLVDSFLKDGPRREVLASGRTLLRGERVA